MRKLLLIGLAVVAVLAGVAVFLLPRFFNAEAQRSVITSRMEAALQRKVKLGSMRLTLFPPSLRIVSLEIAEAPGFGNAPFLTAEEVQVHVTLRPLLDGRLEVPGVEITKPTIRLIRNSKQEWNYTTLGKNPAAADKATTPPPPAKGTDFNVGKVQIKDGTLYFSNVGVKNRPVSLDQVDLKLNHLAAGQSLDYDLSVHTPGKGKGLLKTEGQAGPLLSQTIPLTAKGKAKFEEVDLQPLGPFIDQPGLAGLVTAEASFTQDGKTMPIEGSYNIVGLRLNPKGSPAQAPVSGKFHVRYMGQPERLEIHDLDLNCGQAIFRLSGRLDLARSVDNSMDLKTTNAPLTDAAKLLPAVAIPLPTGSKIASGTLTTSVHLQGRFQPGSGNASIDVQHARLAGFSLGGQLATIAKLVGIPGGPDTQLERLQGTFRMDGGRITTNDLQMVIPGMTIAGKGTMNEIGVLDMKMIATLTGQNAVSGLLQKAIMGRSQLPFLVKGTTERPIFLPDAAGLLQQQVGGRAEGINKILGGFLGRKK